MYYNNFLHQTDGLKKKRLIIMKRNLILHIFVIGFVLNGCQTEKHRTADEWFKQGLLFATTQRYENALNAFTRALEINPRYAEAYNQRGIILGKKDRFDQAIVDFTKAIEINPRYAVAYNNRGVLRAKKGNFDKGINDFTTALEIDPFYADAYYNRGVTWADIGDIQNALVDFKKALKQKPGNKRYQKARALLKNRIKKNLVKEPEKEKSFQ
jgi:tetratricopeptide (TPR) repeat protein